MPSTLPLLIARVVKYTVLQLTVRSWSVFCWGCTGDSAARGERELWQTEGSFHIQATSTAVGLQLSLIIFFSKRLDLFYKLVVNFWWKSSKKNPSHLYVVLVMQNLKHYKLHNLFADYKVLYFFKKIEILRLATYPANSCMLFSFMESGHKTITICKKHPTICWADLNISCCSQDTAFFNLKYIRWF